MELQIYSSVAGDLVNMVHKKRPMTFIPYVQALSLQQQINELQSKIGELNEQMTTKYEIDTCLCWTETRSWRSP